MRGGQEHGEQGGKVSAIHWDSVCERQILFFAEDRRQSGTGNCMNPIDDLRLVHSAPPGLMGSTNTFSQDSASLHPGLFSTRPSGTRKSIWQAVRCAFGDGAGPNFLVSHPFRRKKRKGWGTGVHSQNENAPVILLQVLQVPENRRRSRPEGPSNSPSFRGLKPSASSEVFDLQP